MIVIESFIRNLSTDFYTKGLTTHPSGEFVFIMAGGDSGIGLGDVDPLCHRGPQAKGITAANA